MTLTFLAVLRSTLKNHQVDYLNKPHKETFTAEINHAHFMYYARLKKNLYT